MDFDLDFNVLSRDVTYLVSCIWDDL